jgi:AraC-like DNA-binding protein
VAPGFRLTRHEHDRPHVCAIVEGDFDESHHRGRKRCASGTTRVSPAGDRHNIEFGAEGANCLIVTIDDDCLTESRSAFRERTFFEDAWLNAVASRAFLAAATSHTANTLMMESVGWELIAQIGRQGHTRAANSPPVWLRRIRDRLQDAATPVSMRALADDAGVSREHVARTFRLHFGVSAEDFHRRARIDAACRQLLMTDAPLSSIALEHGFADQSHFTRWCVREKGSSPAAMRRVRDGHITCVQDFSVAQLHSANRNP